MQEEKKRHIIEGEMNIIQAQIKKRKTILVDGKFIFNAPNELDLRVKVIEDQSKNCRGVTGQRRSLSPDKISPRVY